MHALEVLPPHAHCAAVLLQTPMTRGKQPRCPPALAVALIAVALGHAAAAFPLSGSSKPSRDSSDDELLHFLEADSGIGARRQLFEAEAGG